MLEQTAGAESGLRTSTALKRMTDSDIQPHHRRVLDRFVEVATADARIVAAVLCGSYARGAADSFSDLDLGLITTGAEFDDVLSTRESLVRQLGDPLLIEDFDDPTCCL